MKSSLDVHWESWSFLWDEAPCLADHIRPIPSSTSCHVPMARQIRSCLWVPVSYGSIVETVILVSSRLNNHTLKLWYVVLASGDQRVGDQTVGRFTSSILCLMARSLGVRFLQQWCQGFRSSTTAIKRSMSLPKPGGRRREMGLRDA